jgi:DNA-binding MarR family transcriptional regulator
MPSRDLQFELQKRNPFEVPEEEAYLNIIRTQGVLSERLAKLSKQHGITGPQYNILRILRGVGGEGLPCTEIGERMVTREPDMTRLLDRLEQAGLATRHRTSRDRRVVLIKITEKGRELLGNMDEPIAAAHRQNLGHLTSDELAEINRLMIKARSAAPPDQKQQESNS